MRKTLNSIRGRVTSGTPKEDRKRTVPQPTASKQEASKTKEKKITTKDETIKPTDNKPSTSKQATGEDTKVVKYQAGLLKEKEGKMDILSLQQLITSLILQFDGEDNARRPENLENFLNTADYVYKTLETEEKKNIFNSLIRFRLKDDALRRTIDKDIKTYAELKKELRSIYVNIQSIDELERTYMNIKQNSEESISNFSQRIRDALETYEKGFKVKYSIETIEPTHHKHLQNNMVKVFKRGLNNTLLKEKVATSTETNIESLTKEAIIIEKMLMEYLPQSNYNQPSSSKIQNTDIRPIPTHNTKLETDITCNFCQEPGHTLAKCRLREAEIAATTQKEELARHNIKTQSPVNQNWWNTTPPDRPPKYCSYCKTTKGHTFNECRAKLLPRRQPNNFNFNQPSFQNYQQRRSDYNGPPRNHNYEDHTQRYTGQKNYQHKNGFYPQDQQQNNYRNYRGNQQQGYSSNHLPTKSTTNPERATQIHGTGTFRNAKQNENKYSPAANRIRKQEYQPGKRQWIQSGIGEFPLPDPHDTTYTNNETTFNEHPQQSLTLENNTNDDGQSLHAGIIPEIYLKHLNQGTQYTFSLDNNNSAVPSPAHQNSRKVDQNLIRLDNIISAVPSPAHQNSSNNLDFKSTVPSQPQQNLQFQKLDIKSTVPSQPQQNLQFQKLDVKSAVTSSNQQNLKIQNFEDLHSFRDLLCQDGPERFCPVPCVSHAPGKSDEKNVLTMKAENSISQEIKNHQASKSEKNNNRKQNITNKPKFKNFNFLDSQENETGNALTLLFEQNSPLTEHKIINLNSNSKTIRDTISPIISNNQPNLLIDTGADISLIKEKFVDNIETNKRDIIALSGIGQGNTKTLGSIPLHLQLTENFIISHKFHIVPNNFSITEDGIIGRDFFTTHKVVISYRENQLNFKNESVPFSNKKKFKTILPSRCEAIIELPTPTNGLYICSASELKTGIFAPNALIEAKNNKAKIMIANTLPKEVEFDNFQLNIEPFQESILQPEHRNFIEQNAEREEIIIKTITENLDPTNNVQENLAIMTLCLEYSDIFYIEGDKLTTVKGVQHDINLYTDTKPIHIQRYRLPQTHREEINKQVSEMLTENKIKPSVSPFNSPLLAVPKKPDKDGKPKWRVVVDFRKLNEATIGDSFPLPNINDILDQLGHAQYFSTLDMASGYHQIEMNPRDSHKTAFSTDYGHFEFTRMPFGLKNSQATFQRTINNIFRGFQGIKGFIYLDDIIIYGKNLKDHNDKLAEVFQICRVSNLKLQCTKCQFLKKKLPS